MTLGPSRDKNRRRKEAALAAAFPQGIRCQKCLDYGHWSYACTGKRKFLTRPSRTQQLNRALKQREQMVLKLQNEIDQDKSSNEPKKKRQRLDKSDSSSSSSDSSSDSVSSTSSSSSDSEASTSSSSSSTSSSSSDSE